MYTPWQMIFGRDIITASQGQSWLLIWHQKENTNKGVAQENASRISHIFEAGQHVLVKLYPSGHKWKLNAPFEGPWQYSWGECQSQTDVDITRFLLIDNIKNLETNNSFKLKKKLKLKKNYQNLFLNLALIITVQLK